METFIIKSIQSAPNQHSRPYFLQCNVINLCQKYIFINYNNENA